MLSFLPPDVAAFLALLALTLLPGLVVVRSPWTTVPALSVAFWVITCWWLPVESRSQLVEAALAVFGVLALLRLLPRHTVPPPPDHAGPPPEPPVNGPLSGAPPMLRSLPSLMVVATAVATVIPMPLWPQVPGREMAFHTTSARLMVWRDGLPGTYEPLLAVGPFGVHSPALPTLTADLSLLSGLDPGRALAMVNLLLAALALLGLYALLGTRLDPAAAALAALLGLAALPHGFLAVWGEGGPLLALALCLSAAALLEGHTSRPSAFAAGILWAAALLSQPLLALVLLAVTVGASTSRARRSGLGVGVAVLLSAPGLWTLLHALSIGEIRASVASLSLGEVADLVLGLGVLGLAATIARRLARLPGPGRALDAVLAVASAVLLVVGVHSGPAAGQLDDHALRALSELAAEVRPLEPVCAEAELVDWVPALGGRPAGGANPDAPCPWVPPVLRDEASRAAPLPCAKTLDP